MCGIGEDFQHACRSTVHDEWYRDQPRATICSHVFLTADVHALYFGDEISKMTATLEIISSPLLLDI